MDVMPFGKHKDKTFIKIYEEDEQYLRWFIGQYEDDHNKFISKIVDNMFNVLGTPRQQKEYTPTTLIDTSDETCPW